jgi:hypothetical protein
VTTRQELARLGAVAAVIGPIVVFVTTLLHPMSADPNEPLAAFAEYAADSLWVASHLGQFIGFSILAVAFIGLAAAMEDGKPAAWGRVGLIGIAASLALAGALQAVDGVALRSMLLRWMQVSHGARERAFDAALAVRQIEIGLASLLSVVMGLTVVVFAIAMSVGRRFPRWLGYFGFIGGFGNVSAGFAAAYTGFSPLQMIISMPATVLIGVWVIVIGVFLRKVAPGLSENDGAA